MSGFESGSDEVMSGVLRSVFEGESDEFEKMAVATPLAEIVSAREPEFSPVQTLTENPSPEPLEGDVSYVNNDPAKMRARVAIGIALEEAGPPSEEYIQVRDEENRSLTTFIGSQPNPLAKGASALPVRKRGNRRRGIVRAGRNGKALPAIEDPIILRRRAMAMPLWNRGYGASEIMVAINTWLESEGLQPVGVETIRKDKVAIMESWEKDYDASSAMNRQQHISAVNRMKTEAWRTYEEIRDAATKNGNRGLGAASAFLKIALQAEAELATLDGSKKRAEVAAAQQAHDEAATKITRVYVGVDLEEV